MASFEQVAKKLNKAMKDISDFKEPLQDSAEIIVQESKDNFDRQGYLYGSTWKPLSPATRKQRASQGFPANRPILIRSGKLMKGVKVKSVNSREAVVHNPVEFATYHQTGTNKMPQRKVLSSSKKSRTAIGIVFGNYVGKIIKKVF